MPGTTSRAGGATILATKRFETPEPANERAFDQDLELMLRVATRDRAAECALAARLSGRVRRISRALLRNPADADDTAQAALLEILRSAGNYKGLSSIERWADRVVVRTASLLVRQRRRANDRIDLDAELDELPTAAADAQGAEELVRPMHEYLDRLPEPIRMALVLRHAFGYSLEEIGELVEISANAAKKRVSRGHQAMRRMIRKDRVLGLHLGDRT